MIQVSSILQFLSGQQAGQQGVSSSTSLAGGTLLGAATPSAEGGAVSQFSTLVDQASRSLYARAIETEADKGEEIALSPLLAKGDGHGGGIADIGVFSPTSEFVAAQLQGGAPVHQASGQHKDAMALQEAVAEVAADSLNKMQLLAHDTVEATEDQAEMFAAISAGGDVVSAKAVPAELPDVATMQAANIAGQASDNAVKAPTQDSAQPSGMLNGTLPDAGKGAATAYGQNLPMQPGANENIGAANAANGASAGANSAVIAGMRVTAGAAKNDTEKSTATSAASVDQKSLPRTLGAIEQLVSGSAQADQANGDGEFESGRVPVPLLHDGADTVAADDGNAAVDELAASLKQPNGAGTTKVTKEAQADNALLNQGQKAGSPMAGQAMAGGQTPAPHATNTALNSAVAAQSSVEATAAAGAKADAVQDVAASKADADFASTLSSLAPAAGSAADKAAAQRLDTLQQIPMRTLSPAAEQVQLQIKHAVRDGVDRISIRLEPGELGRVDVRIEVKADGASQLHITADKQETLDMLQRDAKELHRALQQAGLKTDEQAMQFDLRQQSQQQFAGNDQPHGKGYGNSQLAANDTAREDDASQIIDAHSNVLNRAGIDIRI